MLRYGPHLRQAMPGFSERRRGYAVAAFEATVVDFLRTGLHRLAGKLGIDLLAPLAVPAATPITHEIVRSVLVSYESSRPCAS